MTPAPRVPRPPAYHRARRLMLERLAAGPATIRELESASQTRGSTTLHHIGVLKLTGDIRRVHGSRPTRLTLIGGQPR